MRRSYKKEKLQNLTRSGLVLLPLLGFILLPGSPSLSALEPPEVTNEFVVTAASMTIRGQTVALGTYGAREVLEIRGDHLKMTDVYFTRFEITGDIVATTITLYCTFIEGTMVGPSPGKISWRPGESISSLGEGDVSMESVRMHLLRMQLGTLEVSEMKCAMPCSEHIDVTFPKGELLEGFQMEGPLPYNYLIDGETVTVKVTETRYASLKTGSMSMLCERADNKWQMSATAMTVESSTTCAVYTKIRAIIITLDWNGDEVPDIAKFPAWLLKLFGVEEGTCRPEGCEGCRFYFGEKAEFSDMLMRDVYIANSKTNMTNVVIQVVFPEPPSEEEEEKLEVDKLLLVNNYFAIGKDWTTIWYEIEKPGNVSLKVYTSHGKLVRTLINEHKEEGTDSEVWTGENEEGEDVAAGIYFVHLRGPGISVTKKICVVK